jgi:Ca2+-binding EF-hand superfamily protein
MTPAIPGLSAEELQLCKAAFTQFDKDGSGAIDTRELKQASARTS